MFIGMYACLYVGRGGGGREKGKYARTIMAEFTFI